MRDKLNRRKRAGLSLLVSGLLILASLGLDACSKAREKTSVPSGPAASAHPQGWIEPSAASFHGKALRDQGWDLSGCQSCHGTDYAGGITEESCLTCHPSTPEDCSVCHGSDINSAPPRDTFGNTAATFPGVGAHQAHVRAGALARAFYCTECHTVPTSVADSTHIDSVGRAEIVFGALADQGEKQPAYDVSTTTCASVYCHGDASVVWTEVGSGQAACGTCHGLPPGGDHPVVDANSCATCHGSVVDAEGRIINPSLHLDGQVEVQAVHPAGWVDESSSQFHGQAIREAGWDLSGCQECHGTDYAGGSVGESCLTCHPSTPEDCSVCHGSQINSAPPEDIDGNTATPFAGVGAHQAHLGDSALTAILACDQCHTVPSSFADPAHIDGDGKAELVWSTLAQQDGTPQYDTSAATCASIYCHGDASVVWTEVGSGQAACGTCHGLPPAGDHPVVDANSCATCHGSVVDTDGQIIDATLHINGQVEVQAVHPSGWLERASEQFHGQAIRTAGWDLSGCQECHGTDYAGGSVGESCLTCHPSTPEDCSVCHGSQINAAPPEDTFGNTATTFAGVGAHQTHLGDSALTAILSCDQCHTVPSSFADPAHIDGDGQAELAWSALAQAGDIDPQYDTSAATCASIYCHGDASVVWTEVGSGQADCGTCHGLPPAGDHPVVDANSCATCHGSVVDTDGQIIDATLHINGQVEVQEVHPSGWLEQSSEQFHGQAIRTVGWDLSGCQECHGTDYAGGSVGESCLTCHPSTPEDCSVCHGSSTNSAPPEDTFGNTETTFAGVGAHQAHLGDSALTAILACDQCHTVPSSFADPTHIDGDGQAELVWGSLVKTDDADPQYDTSAATCASIYCHGDASVVWTDVGSGQADCGTCHGLPPAGDHPVVDANSCATCHGSVVDTDGQIIDATLHINGQVEVQEVHPSGWLEQSSEQFHGQAIRTVGWDLSGCQECHGTDYAGGSVGESCLTCHPSTPEDCSVCHGSQINAAPPEDTFGNTETTFAGVGAHQAHLDESPLIAILACDQCHTVPSSFSDPAHIDGDGRAELVWSALAQTGDIDPQYDASAATCASVYCHGDVSVVWTEVGSDQAACGTCHGLPPTEDHPVVDANSCATCHGSVVDADGQILDATLHINGQVDVQEVHPSGWLERSSEQFHGQAIRTAGWDLSGCQECHGTDYAGGSVDESCLTCHPSTPEDCSVCHGSEINSAPPEDIDGNTATPFAGVGAHQAHLGDSALTAILACDQCHTVPSSFADPTHIDGDGQAELVWSTLAQQDGTPQYDTSAATCASIYCHGDASVVWTEVGSGQADCGTCHGLPPDDDHPVVDANSCATCHGSVVDTDGQILDATLHINGQVEVQAVHPSGWLERSSEQFHGQAIRTAGWDLSGCQECHGTDYAGGSVGESCLTCHPSTPEDCSVCHGSQINAAPPEDTFGNTATTFAGVGAHQTHLGDSALTAILSCDQCHTVPSSFADPAHIDGDGKVELVWSALAQQDGTPQYDTSAATCASIYCHGDASVVWTEVGSDQAACGTCHGLPPAGDHPVVDANSCATCHGSVVDTDGQILDASLHINGQVDVQAVHPSGWLEQSSEQFHGQAIRTAGWDLSGCQECHGTDYAGGSVGESCLTCHPSTPEDCSVCHGTDVNSAPPEDMDGNTATTFTGVGAHQAHLSDSALTAILSCDQCHTVPSSFADPTHIDGDGQAELVWGSLVKTDDADPQYDTSAATCVSIYCHGDASVVWTGVGSGQADCGTCHSLPPAGDHPVVDANSCATCHGSVVDTDGQILDASLHINGQVEVQEVHPSGWLERSSEQFHGQAIRTAGWDLSGCQECHGTDYAGGSVGESCLTCHPSTPEDCSVCHGSQINAAPPEDTFGNTATPFAGVGAHQAHLGDSALTAILACDQCHTVPASFADPAHIDGDGKAELVWSALAQQDGTPQYDTSAATCASIYCHGDASVVWTEVGSGQAACGTCHGLPPAGDHPVGVDANSCATCHGSVVDTDGQIIDATLHINGQVDVQEVHPSGWLERASEQFHGQAIRTAGWDLSGCQECHGTDYAGGSVDVSCLTCHPSTPEDCSVCHGSQINAAPPEDTFGNTATTFAGVGAHQTHLGDSALTAILACDQCHTVPTFFSDPAHIDGDGRAELVWSALAQTGEADPQYDASAATCASVYCHGDASVVWTEVGSDQAACGTCHELPPSPETDHPAIGSLGCVSCHSSTVDADLQIVDQTRHINGQVNVEFATHPQGWINPASDSFHGQAIRAAGWDLSGCQTCHGADYAGGIAQYSCLTCHPSTPEDCSVCHGSGTNNAPPQDTFGNAETTFAGVGAHQAHVVEGTLKSALDCTVCHTVPSSFADPVHIDGDNQAEIVFDELVRTGELDPRYDRETQTCENTYCHNGGKFGIGGSVVWNEVGSGQADCGTCHGAPPAEETGHLKADSVPCTACHGSVVDADLNIIAKELHINGQKD